MNGGVLRHSDHRPRGRPVDQARLIVECAGQSGDSSVGFCIERLLLARCKLEWITVPGNVGSAPPVSDDRIISNWVSPSVMAIPRVRRNLRARRFDTVRVQNRVESRRVMLLPDDTAHHAQHEDHCYAQCDLEIDELHVVIDSLRAISRLAAHRPM